MAGSQVEVPVARNLFVTAVEAGPLEEQCVRMVESLRRNGGALAADPVVAVTSRLGPPLSAATRAIFDRRGVLHLKRDSHPRYAWFHYLNKVLALQMAEAAIPARQVTFIDCDTLIVKEPSALLLAEDEDFTAAPSDEGVVGSTGPACRHDVSWKRFCDLLGLRLDDLPWVVTYMEGLRIRLYWNSGIYAYRTGTGFAAGYLDDCFKVLGANEGFASNGEHNIDQVLLGLTVARLNLRWRHLPNSHNYPVTPALSRQMNSREFLEAAIIHYHDSLQPAHFGAFVRQLQRADPDCAGWLESLGPITDNRPLHWRALSEVLRVWRGTYRRRYRQRVAQRYSGAEA